MTLPDLGSLGLADPAGKAPATFPDGAQFRIEIPSVEGPEALAAVVETASREGITINRVSQGSGAMLLAESELREMAAVAAAAGLEICLFVGPRAGYDVGALAHLGSAMAHYASVRGNDGLRHGVADVLRAIECGIRGFLVADLGLLQVLRRLQADGRIPAEVCWKLSAYFPTSNSATLALLERLGATTVNVPSDLTVAQLDELRGAVSVPLDLYIETSDSSGGTIRILELPALARAGAPMYAKFGLANAPGLYPAGEHLVGTAVSLARAKVHRAAIALEWIARLDPQLRQSGPHAPGSAIPVV
ncbi:U32 family peptidase [Dactylosporangium sucinum]|uniref:Uncharacterized protein n=1 Tax=Dactylosporangium sucinum TaxID=1424081 RepID=A0A917U8F7_9ACTN|nr:U32 family peptidase [Dactylosporangium sucinum]GGM61873.1 hypothetical protein GCM10007977_074190 [Dactylosporangium sucinum]